MTLTREQKFLYTRIAILVLLSLAVGFAFGAWNGYSILYGGFVLCFWGALGLLNYGQHSSVWLLYKNTGIFIVLYGTLVGVFLLTDIFGFHAHLWFYPYYQGFPLFWVWLVLYPFGSLAILELLYFLASNIDGPLYFREYLVTKSHKFFDIFESLLFLVMVATVVLGAMNARWGLALPYLMGLVIFWMLSALVKLRFHIKHRGHYLLIFVIAMSLSALSHGSQGALPRAWIYVETDLLDFLLFGIPSWVWLGWFLFILVTLRLWISSVFYLRAK